MRIDYLIIKSLKLKKKNLYHNSSELILKNDIGVGVPNNIIIINRYRNLLFFTT